MAVSKMGRPRKEFNFELFKELCSIHCTLQEISDIIDLSPDQITERLKEMYGPSTTFPVIRDKFANTGKATLRRSQFKMAHRNPTMSIWLGKQYLGQKEPDNTLTVSKETVDNFSGLMNQLASLQSSFKIAESNNNTESKS